MNVCLHIRIYIHIIISHACTLTYITRSCHQDLTAYTPQLYKHTYTHTYTHTYRTRSCHQTMTTSSTQRDAHKPALCIHTHTHIRTNTHTYVQNAFLSANDDSVIYSTRRTQARSVSPMSGPRHSPAFSDVVSFLQGPTFNPYTPTTQQMPANSRAAPQPPQMPNNARAHGNTLQNTSLNQSFGSMSMSKSFSQMPHGMNQSIVGSSMSVPHGQTQMTYQSPMQNQGYIIQQATQAVTTPLQTNMNAPGQIFTMPSQIVTGSSSQYVPGVPAYSMPARTGATVPASATGSSQSRNTSTARCDHVCACCVLYLYTCVMICSECVWVCMCIFA
jgi:hypothetical protein